MLCEEGVWVVITAIMRIARPCVADGDPSMPFDLKNQIKIGKFIFGDLSVNNSSLFCLRTLKQQARFASSSKPGFERLSAKTPSRFQSNICIGIKF